MDAALNYLIGHDNEIILIGLIVFAIGIIIFLKNAWSFSLKEAQTLEKMKLPMVFNFLGCCVILLRLFIHHSVGG